MTTAMPPSTAIAVAPIRTLLVPLDGSARAEIVVPTVVGLAGRLGASVTLLHVLEHRPPGTIHGERHLRTAAEATAYLDALAPRIGGAGIVVRTHVHANPEHDVARSLADHTVELDGQLIVLAPHGGSGVRGFLFGRMAQQVVRQGTTPLLLLRQPSAHTAAAPLVGRRFAVLLNGTPEAEAVLPPVLTVARAYGASVHLVWVVPTASTLPADRAASGVLVPSATRAILDLEADTAAGYLDGVAARLRAAGLVTAASVVRGDVAGEGVAEAQRAGADLLALTSHGRGGLGGIWSGSVGAKVLARFSHPLLLVPAGSPGPGDAAAHPDRTA